MHEGDSGLRVEVMVEGSVKAGLDTSQAVTTHNSHLTLNLPTEVSVLPTKYHRVPSLG